MTRNNRGVQYFYPDNFKEMQKPEIMLIDEFDQAIIENPITTDGLCMLNGLYNGKTAESLYVFCATCSKAPLQILQNELNVD